MCSQHTQRKRKRGEDKTTPKRVSQTSFRDHKQPGYLGNKVEKDNIAEDPLPPPQHRLHRGIEKIAF